MTCLQIFPNMEGVDICLAGNFERPLNSNCECSSKPLSKRFPVTFKSSPVDVLVLWFVQGRVSIKEVGNESQVQLGVPSDDICGCDKLPAAQPLCLLQHAFCSLDVILLLQRERTRQGWGKAVPAQRRQEQHEEEMGNLLKPSVSNLREALNRHLWFTYICLNWNQQVTRAKCPRNWEIESLLSVQNHVGWMLGCPVFKEIQ